MKEILRKKLIEGLVSCSLNYESDNIRLNIIKSSLDDDEWDMDDSYNEDDLQETEWLSAALNKGGFIDFYELFVPSCWESMFQKEEYKGLNKEDALNKLVNERFENIAKALSLSIKGWAYHNNILIIRLNK